MFCIRVGKIKVNKFLNLIGALGRGAFELFCFLWKNASPFLIASDKKSIESAQNAQKRTVEQKPCLACGETRLGVFERVNIT